MGRSKNARWRAAVLISVNVLMIAHLIQWAIMGMTISPIEPSESMETLEVGVVNAGAVFFLVAILTTLIFGRFFCGWLCHVVALQDLCVWMMTKVGVRPKAFRSRFLVYFPILLGGYMFVWPTFKRHVLSPALEAASIDWPYWLRPVEPLHQWTNGLIVEDFWATFPEWYIAIPFLLICGFACVYFLGAKGFCTYGCPYAAFFKPIDKLAPVRIHVNDDCKQCGYCTSVCTSNVRVSEEVRDFGMVVDPGCMKTLDCISACPNDALSLGFGRPALGAKPKASAKESRKAALAKRRGRYDLSMWEELLAAVLIFWFFFATRGMLDAVPMLLAGGLAAIATMILLMAIKLFHENHVRLYKVQFKQSGRIKPASYLLVLLALGFVVGSAWSGNARILRWKGDLRYNTAPIPTSVLLRPEFNPSPDQRTQAEEAIAAYQRADSPANGGMGWKLNAEHRLRLSYFLSVVDQHDKALEQLRLVIETGSPTDALVLQAGQLLIRAMDDAQGDTLAEEHEAAKLVAILELYADALQSHPRLHAIRAELSKSAASRGDSQGAELYWDIEWQSNQYLGLAETYRGAGSMDDYRESMGIHQRLKDFIEDSKSDPMFTLSHAGMHAMVGEIPEAQRLFEEASEQAEHIEQPAGVWIDIGRSALQFGLPDLAREQARKAVEDPSATAMTWVAGAEIASFSGDFQLGRQRVEQAMAMPRFDDHAMLMARGANATLTPDSIGFGHELLRKGVETAEDPFEKFAIARGMVFAGNSLGSLEMIDEGITLLLQITEEHPEFPVIAHDVSSLLYQIGRNPEALELLIQAAEADSTNALLARRAAEMSEAIGNTEQAQRWNEEARRREE